MIEIILLTAGLLLFLAGFYTGVWVQRHSYTDREVPKVIETQRVVEVEKPVVIQVPRPSANNGQLAVIGNNGAKAHVLDPKQKAESEHMVNLLNQIPEA